MYKNVYHVYVLLYDPEYCQNDVFLSSVLAKRVDMCLCVMLSF